MTHAELEDRLAELLVSYKVVTPEVLERARTYQTAKRCTLAGALSHLHLAADDVIAPLLEEITGTRSVNPSLLTVYPTFIESMNTLIPPEAVARLLIFPAQSEINTIHVCMLNTTDGWTSRALESLSGCRVMPFITHEAVVLAAIEKHYAPHLREPPQFRSADGHQVVEHLYRELLDRPFEGFLDPAQALINRTRDAIARDPAELEALIRDPAIIRLVQQILCRAIEATASDVHIEPTSDGLRIRARVDGAMQLLHTLPSSAVVPITARLKAMAELPVTPATSPLDGRIGYDIVLGRAIDLRFSLVPSISGERIVLRVLDRTRERSGLSDLGIEPAVRSEIQAASELPNGLLLVTGPTGSGKSSTLYALLDQLSDGGTCILTAEDPVESRMAGVTQVQCDEASGLTFAAVLRSFLRQDPDILMVGEIRDTETADIALKAALTGHLVLSTLHTNDTPGAVLRLINMDLEPFLIASALRLVVAQRLIRRLCATCKVAAADRSEAHRTLLQGLTPGARSLLQGQTIYGPGGCAECSGVGYRGRTGIFEVLRVNAAIEELIIERASAAAIRAQAHADGMQTLREAGLRKVAAGETSVAEVLEHTVADLEGAESLQERRRAHA